LISEIKLILPPRDPKVRYLKKFDHPPMIKRGRELINIDYNTGWVEHMSTYCDLYYTAGISTYLIELCKGRHLDRQLTHYNQQRKVTILGLVRHLTDIRREEPFMLPLFGSFLGVDTPSLTCGATRFAATILAGSDPAQTPCIWQVPKGETRAVLGPTTLVTSTLHAEELCNLEQVEYALEFEYNNGQYKVISSVLRGTVYDYFAYDKNFTDSGESIVKFWDRHRNAENNKIKITVACDLHARKFVLYSPEDWDVTFIDLECPNFSYVNVLTEFANSTDPHLRLEVRGVTEKFWLEYLVPLTDATKVWFHTLDKKLNLVDTTKGPAGADCTVEIWGNLVK
jgi:hypothetical protein